MKIKINNITVDQQSLTPTLSIGVNIDFNDEHEAPISITGRLLTDNIKNVYQLIFLYFCGEND